MSHTNGNTFGLEHGKIGDRIEIYKGLYKPTNPRTPKQQMHRAKIAFANRLSKELTEAVNLGFATVPEPGSGQSPRNAFVKMNWDNGSIAWTEREQNRANGQTFDEREQSRANGQTIDEREQSRANGQAIDERENGNVNSDDMPTDEWGICPERLRLAYGPRYIGRGMTAEIRDGRLFVTCPDPGLNDSHAVADDRLMVAVYRPSVPVLHLYPGPLRNVCTACDFELPTDISGKEEMMHVYAWFQATLYHRSSGGKITVRPGQASPSLFLGSF